MFNFIATLKDPISGLTHIIAALLSIAGLILLVCRAASLKKPMLVVSFTIYGTSLIALFCASALYHSLRLSPGATDVLEKLDHAMIYYLIAGTYTPICLCVLRGAWGWSLFGVNWGLAAAGITLKLVFTHPPFAVIAILFAFYIMMGWLIVIAWKPLTRVLPKRGIFWLVLGGIFYTAGTPLISMKFLNVIPGYIGPHEIWHLFVMAGSFCHFWLMFKFVTFLTLNPTVVMKRKKSLIHRKKEFQASNC